VGNGAELEDDARQSRTTGPVEVSVESWFSPDLQIALLIHTSDPRFGETEYRLSDIHRSEPDPALFEIPSDYTVQQDPPHQMKGRGVQ
jgi:hypothetical protein